MLTYKQLRAKRGVGAMGLIKQYPKPDSTLVLTCRGKALSKTHLSGCTWYFGALRSARELTCEGAAEEGAHFILHQSPRVTESRKYPARKAAV